jgi:hypothetical protein
MTSFSPGIVEKAEDGLMSSMSPVFLLGRRTLGEPLLQQAILVHVQLERGTQANVRLHLCLGFALKPGHIVCGQLCDKQFKLELLLALFQLSKDGKLFFKLLVPHFLHANFPTLKTFRGIDVSRTQLREEESMGVLDCSSTTFLPGRDACIGHIKEILEFLWLPELINIGEKRTRVQVLEGFFKNKTLQ